LLSRCLLLLAHLLLLLSISFATASAVGTAVAPAASTAKLYAGHTGNEQSHNKSNVTQSAGTSCVRNVTATAC
jgi:hypothetical protein